MFFKHTMKYTDSEIQSRSRKLFEDECFLNVTQYINAIFMAEREGVSNLPVYEEYLYCNENYKQDEHGNFPDIDQWWAVSCFLAEDLKNQGEVVLDVGGHRLWGRVGGGQAVYMDSPFLNIAKKLLEEG